MNVCDGCGSDVVIMHGLCPGCIAHEEVARKKPHPCVAPPIAPAPQWSTEVPPPGWYWRRIPYPSKSGYTTPCPVEVEIHTRQTPAEYWPIRIEPPR